MKTNLKIMKIGIGLIITVLIGCISFTYSVRLKQPIFFKNAMEVSAVSNTQISMNNQMAIQIQYITNYKDKKSVVGISFVEEPDFSFTATEYLPNQGGFNFYNSGAEPILGENIGRYSLRTVYLYMNNYFKEDWKGEMQLHTAKIHFNDGDTLVTDIGSIIIYSDEDNREGIDNEEFSSSTLSGDYSSSSNNGVSVTSYKVNEDINLLNMESPLLATASNRVELIVGDTNYDEISGLELKKGSRLKITSTFGSLQDWVSDYDFYDIRPQLYYENSEGTIESIRLYNIRQKRYFYGMKDILSYLWKRRAF